VLSTRAGITVENGNCDAEGRLILADALFEACRTETPDLLIDAATLTGAARAGLGPEVPAVFSSDDAAWRALEAAAAAEGEHLCRLPLHAAYRKQLESKVADISSTAGEGAQGGAILAALFLQARARRAAAAASAACRRSSVAAAPRHPSCAVLTAPLARARQEFAKGAPRWLHIDTGAWTAAAFACPGRPEGGEALGLRALARFLRDRYAGGGGV
jgi:leucyl aminopeptidase